MNDRMPSRFDELPHRLVAVELADVRERRTLEPERVPEPVLVVRDHDGRAVRTALDEELVARGYGPPTYAANWYPTVEEFTAVYEAAGFIDIEARLIERPTPLEHGVAPWVLTFRKGWLDRAEVPLEERQSIADAVAARVGDTIADYVRLRFTMRKPN